jgi:uncharacterized Tic20 family protein
MPKKDETLIQQPVPAEVPATPVVSEAPPAPPAPPAPAVSQPAPLSPSEERNWAMLAHLSVLINLVTGLLGALAALIIYLVFRDRSRYVAYHAMQSFIAQLICWGGVGLIIAGIWGITGMLSLVLIGLLCIPLACCLTPLILLLPVFNLVGGVWGGIQTSQGHDFKYWLVGDWVRGILTGE